MRLRFVGIDGDEYSESMGCFGSFMSHVDNYRNQVGGKLSRIDVSLSAITEKGFSYKDVDKLIEDLKKSNDLYKNIAPLVERNYVRGEGETELGYTIYIPEDVSVGNFWSVLNNTRCAISTLYQGKKVHYKTLRALEEITGNLHTALTLMSSHSVVINPSNVITPLAVGNITVGYTCVISRDFPSQFILEYSKDPVAMSDFGGSIQDSETMYPTREMFGISKFFDGQHYSRLTEEEFLSSLEAIRKYVKSDPNYEYHLPSTITLRDGKVLKNENRMYDHFIHITGNIMYGYLIPYMEKFPDSEKFKASGNLGLSAKDSLLYLLGQITGNVITVQDLYDSFNKVSKEIDG